MWEFNWWFRFGSKPGFWIWLNFNQCYEFDLCLGRKKKTELNLVEIIVLQFSKNVEGTNWILVFDNFFNSRPVEKNCTYASKTLWWIIERKYQFSHLTRGWSVRLTTWCKHDQTITEGHQTKSLTLSYGFTQVISEPTYILPTLSLCT